MIKNNTKNIDLTKIIENMLFNLGSLGVSEILCIITDYETKDLGELFLAVAKNHGIKSNHYTIKPLNMHGEEPPSNVSNAMKESDLIVGLTKLSMAHTNARRIASEGGNRYLSLPDYSLNLLLHPALMVDFRQLGKKAKAMSEKLSKGKKLKIMTVAGTNITLDISGRKGNFAPGYVNKNILLGSPPDIEANVCPIENKSNGTVVVDGSIPLPGIGKLTTPITLEIENGKIISIKGNQSLVQKLDSYFDKYGENAKILGECGIGFNDKADLSGNMLLDEGCYGTIHFGFGSNISLGGLNSINFHLDFVFYAKELILDNECILI